MGNLTDYTLTGLQEETPYYITITAYDTQRREGWYGVEVNNLAMLAHSVYLPVVLKQH